MISHFSTNPSQHKQSVSVRDRALCCVFILFMVFTERLVVWMHYQLPHTSLNTGLWGGWGGGVYLEKWGTRPDTTKVSISVIKYGETHKKPPLVVHSALGGRCQIQPRFSVHHQTFSQRCLLKWEMKRIWTERNLWLRCNWDLFSFRTFHILLLMINAVISCLWTSLGVGRGSRFSPPLLILKRISHGKHQRAAGGKCKNIYWAASEVEEDIFHPLWC